MQANATHHVSKQKKNSTTFAHGQQESIVTNLGLPHSPLPPPPPPFPHELHTLNNACNSTTKSLLKTKEREGYEDVDNILSTRKD
jgi:hypothetical protein